MIIEVITVFLLMQCVSLISRSIGRRRDVLYYITKSDPH